MHQPLLHAFDYEKHNHLWMHLRARAKLALTEDRRAVVGEMGLLLRGVIFRYSEKLLLAGLAVRLTVALAAERRNLSTYSSYIFF